MSEAKKPITLTQPIPEGYKAWIIASLAVLVGSLVLLAADVTAGFVYFDGKSPLWVTILGVVAVLGIGLGFAGFLVLMLVAGWRNWREGRKVQVIPPVHTS